MDLGASFKLMSQHSDAWSNPRLDSTTGAHIGAEDQKNEKDYWIELDFTKPSEVYQVILKRRADAISSKDPNMRGFFNTHVKVQY
jgi:hypothetical protein